MSNEPKEEENKVMTDNELIAEFMGERIKLFDGEPRIKTLTYGLQSMWSTLKYHTSWDWLMPVVTLLLNKLRFTKWETRDQHEWAEVHRTHLERRLLDYIYDDTTSQSDFVQEIIEVIKWYNANQITTNGTPE